MSVVSVFGYGSLVHLPHLRAFLGRRPHEPLEHRFCRLQGYRRVWNVAMDNMANIPGYKYYLSAESGEREPLYVAFLNIVPQHDASINGILFRVSEDELAAIDRRERNYRFIDVSDRLDTQVPGPVLVNVGTDEALRRYDRGMQEQRVVVSHEYLGEVERAFRDAGESFYQEYLASTHSPGVPVKPLKKVSIKALPGAETSAKLSR